MPYRILEPRLNAFGQISLVCVEMIVRVRSLAEVNYCLARLLTINNAIFTVEQTSINNVVLQVSSSDTRDVLCEFARDLDTSYTTDLHNVYFSASVRGRLLAYWFQLYNCNLSTRDIQKIRKIVKSNLPLFGFAHYYTSLNNGR